MTARVSMISGQKLPIHKKGHIAHKSIDLKDAKNPLGLLPKLIPKICLAHRV